MLGLPSARRANEAGTALRTIFFGLLDDVASDPAGYRFGGDL